MTNYEASQQTKNMIAGTLRSLMAEKPFSKITVSEIVKICGINRKTFYYYFEGDGRNRAGDRPQRGLPSGDQIRDRLRTRLYY